MIDFNANPPHKRSGLYGPYQHYPIDQDTKRPLALYGYNPLEDFINVYRQNSDQYTWKILKIGRNTGGRFIIVGARVGEKQLSLHIKQDNLSMIEIRGGVYRTEVNVEDAIKYLNANLPVQGGTSRAIMNHHSDMEFIKWYEDFHENLNHFEKYKRPHNQATSEQTLTDRDVKPRKGDHGQFPDFANRRLKS